jgi:hypothetical protein
MWPLEATRHMAPEWTPQIWSAEKKVFGRSCFEPLLPRLAAPA